MNVAEAIGSKQSINICIDLTSDNYPIIVAGNSTSNVTQASLVMPMRYGSTPESFIKNLRDQNLSPDGATDGK